MESLEIKNLSFTYPKADKKALEDINLTVKSGDFLTLCGKSGCGKTTLLRLLKSSLAPNGEILGNLLLDKKPLYDLDRRAEASEIGFVMQNPDNQIVTDKVWHELAFGLESLGCDSSEIRRRVAETASFFGIGEWFHKDVNELSGGQKQLLNLASVTVMQPSLLILDEPTSMLDPIAAREFLQALERINRELGTTVILSEHRLEDAFPISDRVIVMDDGRIIADGTPQEVGRILSEADHDMFLALPTPMKICSAIDNTIPLPLSVREGRDFLLKYCESHPLYPERIPTLEKPLEREIAIEIKDAFHRYEKSLPDTLKGFNLTVYDGEILAIVGGNGVGKTTALSIMGGIASPYRGEVRIFGKAVKGNFKPYRDTVAILPQNPQALFVKSTVRLDLEDALSKDGYSEEEIARRIDETSSLCEITRLLDRHPYDLSGGEQQRAALAKLLMRQRKILLLDEPTKGMDAHFKESFANILKSLSKSGVTIVIVSHDIEFCAEHTDRCAMLFDGTIISNDTPREFFKRNSYYTTSTCRMARSILPEAVLANDVILALGKEPIKRIRSVEDKPQAPQNKPFEKTESKKTVPLKRVVVGAVFALLFVITCVLYKTNALNLPISDAAESAVVHITAAVFLAGLFLCLTLGHTDKATEAKPTANRQKFNTRTILASLFVLVAVPLTILLGITLLDDRRYYFISLAIILETMLPFLLVFESRKPKARELVLISVLCALTVAGRAAFFALPQFKPVVALIIVAAVCFGSETGFLVGAITGFVSSFFFGQGPWTPWQMFALGLIGFISGFLFHTGFLRKSKLALCIFGAVVTIIVYGGIMNPASAIIAYGNPTIGHIVSAFVAGLPFDLIHAASTVFFLFFISEAMIEKLERVKIKYGLMN